MAWLEIVIDTQSDSIDEVAAQLTAAGFADLVLEDQQEFAQFLSENRVYWDYIDEQLQSRLQGLSHIKLYLEEEDLPGKTRLQQVLDRLRSRKELGELTVHTALLPETDWSESWKENYPPQPVGEKLIVLPYWLEDAETFGRLPVILDPGLTFGTGAHPSTQMVMEVMEQCVTPGCTCLDLGSGSGILSIAALRLGAGSAIGVDIDPKAEEIARQNVALNGLAASSFTAYTGNVIADKALMQQLQTHRYELVLVNIVADVIIGLAPVLPRLLTEESHLILSGILDTRQEDVLAALQAAGLTITAIRAKEDWRCVCAKRSNV